MTANQVRGLMTAIAIVVGAEALGRVSGQAAQPKGDDVLPSRLVEVKGLRAAMEQMAAAGPRVQLVVSRLQLQDGDKSSDGLSEDKDGVFGGLRAQVAAAKPNIDRLSAEEAQLANDLAAEQARWVDINQRLDELAAKR